MGGPIPCEKGMKKLDYILKLNAAVKSQTSYKMEHMSPQISLDLLFSNQKQLASKQKKSRQLWWKFWMPVKMPKISHDIQLQAKDEQVSMSCKIGLLELQEHGKSFSQFCLSQDDCTKTHKDIKDCTWSGYENTTGFILNFCDGLGDI
eukprot:scaffold40890_cov62-Attheya_sp.AAC.2